MNIPDNIHGLNAYEVAIARKKFGSNAQVVAATGSWKQFLLGIWKEPVLLLLAAVTVIYILTGAWSEAYFMAAAIVVVYGISVFQDRRNRKALQALEQLNSPLSTVIREGRFVQIATREMVVGDMMVVAEGNTINADGRIVYSHDFSVNESMLTGETYAVYKSVNENNKVYSGTAVASGLAVCEVEKTGSQTKIGLLGQSVLAIREEPTPLQLQINRLVKSMGLIGLVMFTLVWLFNYLQSGNLVDSLLKGLTLAMSIVPEEIPVAFTTFMALGSWRLTQRGVIVKKIRTVETLGCTTTICTDKTGTLTENRMILQAIYAFDNYTLFENGEWNNAAAQSVIRYAMWASEPVPFDTMEIALHQAYESVMQADERPHFRMVHEYPLGGRPPMMTHVFENNAGQRIIAAKGAPEAILQVTNLSTAVRDRIITEVNLLAGKGYRVLGVAYVNLPLQVLPAEQQQLPFSLAGLVAFYDPPKKNIHTVFQQFYQAGITIKIITGDSAATTKAVAVKARLQKPEESIDGSELLALSPYLWQQKLQQVNIFTRMFPEVKLELVNALKKNGEVVAMVGDGVNDAPALKASHIGIAMGKKGTEMARQSADLVLLNDDLAGMVSAIAEGRRIYANIKKAVLYIVSIHIPIILTVSLPLFLHWEYANILTPVHVIFLELIMGPTCSIAYENEPMERRAMQIPPRPVNARFLLLKEMGICIIQGLVITAGVLVVYRMAVLNQQSEAVTRAMVFNTLIWANIFLTLADRSFSDSFLASCKKGNRLLFFMIMLTILMNVLILYTKPVSSFFNVQPINATMYVVGLLTAMVSVGWFEWWKWCNRRPRLHKSKNAK